MSDNLSESSIVRAVAEIAAERVARKVVADLQKIEDTLSGDDSGLINAWDEICVQVQQEYSFYWGAYDTTARLATEKHVRALPEHVRNAIWLQTDKGIDWICEESDVRRSRPDNTADVVSYLLKEYVYLEAGRWSNARIRAFIDRSY